MAGLFYTYSGNEGRRMKKAGTLGLARKGRRYAKASRKNVARMKRVAKGRRAFF